MLHGQSVQEGLDQDGQLVGRSNRVRAHLVCPPGKLSLAAGLCLPVPSLEHRSHIRVAGRPQPQLVLQEHPASDTLVIALADVAPHRPQLRDRLVGHRHLGEQDGKEGLLPPIEERQQKALLGTKMGVDGARGPPGCRGHGVDRDAIDAVLGEQVSRRGQQPCPGLGLALVLGQCHWSPPPLPVLVRRRRTYIGNSIYLGAGVQR